MDGIKLSTEQQAVIDTFTSGKENLLVIGKAGVGKSVTLRALRHQVEVLGLHAIVCAPTGVAAINVNGCTIHHLIQTLYSVKDDKLKAIDAIIIDEVSMLRADLFDKLDKALKYAMKSKASFGGARIILIGDPGQLPPVVKDGADSEYISDNYLSPYFFSAACYANSEWKVIELTQIFRQTDDTFVKLLNMVRDGEKVKTVKALNQHFITDEPQGVVLCTTNRAAEEINDYMLSELPGELKSFDAVVRGSIQEYEYPAPGTLEIKEGARVMVIKNVYKEGTDEYGEPCNVLELVNGDWCEVQYVLEPVIEQDFMSGEETHVPKGIVVFCDRTQRTHTIYPALWEQEKSEYDKTTKEITTKVVASFVQFPLRLAWAVTIHKSQGATIEELTIDMRRPMFAAGQLYVALSRGVSMDGLNIIGRVRPKDVIICDTVSAFLRDFKTGVGIKSGGIHDEASAADLFKARAEKRKLEAAKDFPNITLPPKAI